MVTTIKYRDRSAVTLPRHHHCAARGVAVCSHSEGNPKAATKKVVETVTVKAVFEQLAEALDMPKRQALAMATGIVDMVTGILKAGYGVAGSVPESGFQPVISRAHARAFSLSVMPGNNRRNSTAANNSPP
jgi:hypothetical protein